jgi:demethylmenaquinone methyltransferase/2-methoxy-6-polyprenyl-1,4-benzoquinol methylase
MSAESTLISYYAQRAREYERIYEKPERQADLRKLRSLVPRAFAGKKVLELACGTGYWTEIVADAASSILALDVNDEVLDIARAKPIDRRKVSFQRADVYALPVFPEAFTGCLGVFWWSHVPKQRLPGFLRGLHRALAPGARVVFMDNAYVEGSSTPISRADADGNTYQKRKLDDGSVHEVLKNFPTGGDLSAAVADLACDVEVKFLEYYWMLSYVAKGQR